MDDLKITIQHGDKEGESKVHINRIDAVNPQWQFILQTELSLKIKEQQEVLAIMKNLK